MKLRDDNIDMTSKLKSVYEQYEIREQVAFPFIKMFCDSTVPLPPFVYSLIRILYQQMEKMGKQMELESQLYEAKVSKLEMEATAEKEILLREKQQLLMVNLFRTCALIFCA